jgi:CRP/FNR family transcriptional regulator
MIPIQVESAWKGTSDCRDCGIRDMVLFADLTEEDFSLIHAPIDDLRYVTGSLLYSEGDKALGVMTVRAGMVKLVRNTSDGRQRIVRVLRPGDVAGLEALATAHYDCDAIALSEVSVCRIPLEVMHTLSAHSPRLHRRLMQKWQSALKSADDWLAELNFGSAKQRVARFILKMRHAQDPQLISLFSRDDMGAMLDLKLETVSREVSFFVREGVLSPLDKQGRLYQLVQASALENL